MIVTERNGAFAFSFTSVEEIIEFNDWLDSIDLSHAKVPLPFSRTQRRIQTKSPSILRATCEDGETIIRTRWLP